MAEKIRKVIGKAVVQQSFPGAKRYLADAGINYDQVSTGTECEIVALVHPERQLVRPEGAVWKPHAACKVSQEWNLITEAGVIASVWVPRGNISWRGSFKQYFVSGDFETKQKAFEGMENALASEKLHGFHWNQ